MGNNNPLEIKVTPSYQRLVDYWTGKGPRPSQEFASAALDSLLVNIRLENNIVHRDVIDAMFRQVYSDKALPWADNIVDPNAKTLIPAVGYDLGRQGVAYFDRDSARYQYTPGVKTDGNKGHVVRNDGVDIFKGLTPADDYIFSIEDGEWLQYTLRLKKGGKYRISLSVSSGSNTGRISLYAGDKLLAGGLAVPDTGDAVWTSVTAEITLPVGTLPLRVVADKGGFVLRDLQLSGK